MTRSDALVRAQRALDLVGADPRAALRAADQVLFDVRPRESPEAVGTAQRAAALALKEIGDLDSAETRLRAGVRATSGRSERAEAEARMSLAFILLERGRSRAALAQADRAAGALSGPEGARLLGQRALVLQRCGDTSGALLAYGKALPVLRRAGDTVWESTLLNNRALLHAYRGSLVQARADLERARLLMAQADQKLDVARVDWNLGFVAAVEGDVPEALARYDRAEAYYASEGLSVGRILLDRAAVLLQVGLLDEARSVLARAVADLEVSGASADVAEGLVAAAQVALARGYRAEASDVARQAERLTTRQDRPAWTLLARQVAFLAEVAGQTSRRTLGRGLPLAGLLHDAGWREEEQDVLLLCAEAAIGAGDLARSTELLERASGLRHARASAVRHRVWYVRALLREARWQRSSALRAVIAGLASLDDQRAVFGATELRAQVAGQAAQLSALGLRLAVAEGRPGRILQVAEMSRAGGLRLRPVRPPRDAELAAALAELRQTIAAEHSGRMDESPRASARSARVAEVEDRVRRLSRGVPGVLGASAAAVAGVSQILDALGDRVLAEYVVADGDLHVVTCADGWVQRHALGPLGAVEVEVDTLRFTLQRLTVDPSARLLAAFETAASRLSDLLVGPAPELLARELVVSPVGVLQGVPWACLPALRAIPLCVTPSATLWRRAISAPHPVDARVVFAAGPDLPAAYDEIVASSAPWRRPVVLSDEAATVADTLIALEGSSVAHIAAHGRLRTDNPLFSSLELADGPLTVYDLERLDRAPSVVVLPACRSAVSTVRSGEELLGLAAAFLALGSRSVVASVIPVPDAATAKFMPRLHKHLATGLPVAAALTVAVGESENGVEAATARSFVCLGSG